MRKTLTLTLMAALMLAASQSFAQDAAKAAPAATTAPAAGKIAPVLKQIPAGGMCFFVINDISAFTGSIDKFVDAIGLGEIAKDEMPDGVLKEMMGKMNMQAGFNPAGGIGFVMLDPAKYGEDLADFLPPPIGAGKDSSEWKPPFVVFIPGTGGVEGIFGADKVVTDPENKTGYTKFTLDFGPLYGVQMGDYLAVSPTDKALATVAAEQKKVVDELSKTELAAIEKAGFAINVNMKAAGTLVDKILENLDNAEFHDDSRLIVNPLVFNKEIISQISSLSLCMTFGESGLRIDPVVDFKSDSKLGVALAAFKGSDKPPVGRVPNLECAIGLGAAIVDSKLMAEMDVSGIKALADTLKMTFAWDMPADLREKITKSVQEMDTQTTGIQFALGASAAGSGSFGAALLVECNDSAKYVESLSNCVASCNEMFASVTDEKTLVKLNEFKLNYAKESETIDGIKVDAIELMHPKLDVTQMQPDDVAKMKKLFGTDKLRVLIAAVDAKTVLMTFGGDKDYMAQAIQAAKKGGAFDTAFATTMKDLPANLNFIAAIDAANIMALVGRISAAVGEELDAPVEFKANTPAVIGFGSTGSTLQGTVIVPAGIINSFVRFAMEMAAPPPAPQPMPVAPPVE